MNNVVVLVGILITVNDFIRFSTCHFKETFRRMATQVADQVVKGLFRTVLVVPLALLFLANLAGVVASLSMAASSMAASHNTKKKLKAILNLDKLVEVALITVAFVRFTIFPSPTTPREVYVGNIFHSVVCCNVKESLDYHGTTLRRQQHRISRQRNSSHQRFMKTSHSIPASMITTITETLTFGILTRDNNKALCQVLHIRVRHSCTVVEIVFDK